MPQLFWHVGKKKKTKPSEKEEVAFLLPAAIAYLQQLSNPAVPAVHAASAQQLAQDVSSAAGAASMPTALSAARQAVAGSGDDNTVGHGPRDAVRIFFAAEMMQYMTARPKAPQGMALFRRWECAKSVGIQLLVPVPWIA